MLYSLIAFANRGPAPTPPPPPVIFYGNQVVAATTTFACIQITTQAAALTTSLPVRYALSLSWPGQESILDQFNRVYHQLISPAASASPILASTLIGQIVSVATTLSTILQTLPVSPANLAILGTLQQRLLLALRVLKSLAVPPNALSFS